MDFVYQVGIGQSASQPTTRFYEHMIDPHGMELGEDIAERDWCAVAYVDLHALVCQGVTPILG